MQRTSVMVRFSARPFSTVLMNACRCTQNSIDITVHKLQGASLLVSQRLQNARQLTCCAVCRP